jgi:putative ABC transport system permease protein
MISHYIKIAIRTLLKFKGFAAINISGLALGIASGILILLYVLDEFSFDNFHSKADRIYRVNTVFGADENGGGTNETNGWPIGNILRTEFPEVEAVVYTRNATLLIDHEGKKIRERMHFASPEFFELFSFPIVKGNTSLALTKPFTMVISEDMEKKYFSGRDAIGQTLTLNDTLLFEVTGVMANIPGNSHIQADILISFATFQTLNPQFSYSDGWGNINMRNYVLMKEGVDRAAFQAKAKNLYMERVGEMLKNWGVEAYVSFEPFNDIYLKTKAGNGMGPVGSIERIYLLAGVALFVIILACINFINLATARSTHRAKEVGLRKVVGSARGALIRQFIGESFVITTLSLLVALAMVGVFLPVFNQLLGKHYQFIHLINPYMLISIIALLMATTLLAGYYPAWVLSGLRPSEILKGKIQNSTRGIQLRRTLVVFQFFISFALVTGTLIIINQLDYMQKKELGFSKDQVVVINAARVNSKTPDGFEVFINELRQQSFIKHVTLCNAVPGVPGWQGQVAYPDGKTEESIDTEYMAIDEHYIHTLNLSLIAGRNFDPQNKSDLTEGLIINEKSVTRFGWGTPENAIGKKIESPSGTPQGTVIGVVRDYHELGLQQPIGPMAMAMNPSVSYLYAIRFTASDTKEMLTSLEQLWKKNFPSYDFSFFFLDEKFEQQYQSEQRLANVFFIFSVITILIALIGLFGLVSFMVISKTKEIGIRKVLGATVFNITRLLSTEFVILVVIANVIAVPLVWYYAHDWLQHFAYRMEIKPVIFIITFAGTIIITIATVSFQALKAALSNPVNSLRNE